MANYYNPYTLLEATDLSLLKSQRDALIKLLAGDLPENHTGSLEGLVNFLDAVCDCMEGSSIAGHPVNAGQVPVRKESN